MNLSIIILLVVVTILILPLLFIFIPRVILNYRSEISRQYAYEMGYLISADGPIRIGKTSFQSGLSHFFQEEMMMKVQDLIDTVRKIYKNLDYVMIDNLINDEFNLKPDYPEFDLILEKLVIHLESLDFVPRKSVIFNFFSSKTTMNYLEDYIFAYWVLNYRNNYVQSKTPFYSHITGNMSHFLNVEDFKINESFGSQSYSINDYMVLLIDEVTDEQGAQKRLENVKEDDGQKDYYRKFGQIHQERNRLITTKQESADQIARLRRLTQSNCWIDEKVSQYGSMRLLLALITSFFNIFYFFYSIIFVVIPFAFKKLTRKTDITLEDYKDVHYRSINLKRKLDNKLLYIDWYLFSMSYNKYVIHIYDKADDVGKHDTTLFKKHVLIIPIYMCFGTYETHFWKNIQKEQLQNSTVRSKETNWFHRDKYFEKKELREENNDVDFI